MGNDVYANGREISCKAAEGKAIAAFPDFCFTPPPTLATPTGVPIPYPNTGFASDATNGSKTVKITGKEVMLKNRSYFKKSTGDEPATRSLAMGVITHTITGKVYFTSWSMDVKFEGENVVRHFDLTTHNHASMPPNTPPWMYVDQMAISAQLACQDEIDRAEEACQDSTPENCASECRKAQKCLLVPKGRDEDACCRPGHTGHHMIEDHWTIDNSAFPMAQGSSGYNAAPCVCVDGSRYTSEHGEMHNVQGLIEESYMTGGINADKPWNYGAAKAASITAHDMVFSDSNCSKECLEAQLDAFYGEDESRSLNSPSTQGLAITPRPDGRWLRSEAEEALAPLLGGS